MVPRRRVPPAGVALPPAGWSDAKWTWPAFLELTQAHHRPGRGSDFGYDGQQNWWYAQPWVWSNGGNILNADNTAGAFDRPEAQEGFQWTSTSSTAKGHAHGADLNERRARRPMFYAGRLAW